MDFKTNHKRLEIGEGKISGYLSIFIGACSFLFSVSLFFLKSLPLQNSVGSIRKAFCKSSSCRCFFLDWDLP